MTSVLLKVEGAGNDFLLGVGEWAERIATDPELVRRLCRQHRGIGADGALAMRRLAIDRVELVYRNADGGEATFCANGTRCAARVAVDRLGCRPSLRLLTGAGEIPAVVHGDRVTLRLPPPGDSPRDLALGADWTTWRGSLLVVGVPHLVVPVADLAGLDVDRVGRQLRGHPDLGAAGANVTFVASAALDAGADIALRTFERGVEAETLCCGTGVAAAAVVEMARTGSGSVSCRVASGDRLEVRALGAPPGSSLELTGPATIVAEVIPLER